MSNTTFGKLHLGSTFSVALAYSRPFRHRQQCILQLGCPLSIATARAFSCPSALASKVGDAKHHNTLFEPENVLRPMATWLTTRGAGMDTEKVLNQLPRLTIDENPELTKSLTTALFLVTPQLAHLFEPGHNFHAAAMSNIFPSQIDGVQRRSIVAVVDALPAIAFFARAKPEISGYEGLGVCVSNHFTTQEENMKINNTPVITLSSTNAGPNLGDASLLVRWKALTANTLFVNGRPHTMFEQHWLESDDKSYAEHMNRRHLSSLEIPIYAKRHGRQSKGLPAHMYTKVDRLTKPAAIVTSMGNIIRQIKTESGNLIAASHELERIIPPLVKSKHEKYPSMELRVFALVYPSELANRDRKPFSDKIFNEPNGGLNLGSLQALLVRGARLYRVTSGGAGWGNKAGLLSLEPTTELNSQDDTSNVFEPSFDFQADSIRMPGSADLFPPGHMVQFVASWHETNGEHKEALTIADLPRHTKWLRSSYFEGTKSQSLCVGTTIIPEPTEDQSRYTEAEQKVDQVFCPNRFGFLTASSMSLSTELLSEYPDIHEKGSPHSTLIEVPNSSFIATSPASGEETELSDIVTSKHSQRVALQNRKIEPSLKTPITINQAPLEPRKEEPHAKKEAVRGTGQKKPDIKHRPRFRIRKIQAKYVPVLDRIGEKPDSHRDTEDRGEPIRTMSSALKIRTRRRDGELDQKFREETSSDSYENDTPAKKENSGKTVRGTFESRKVVMGTLRKKHSLEARSHLQNSEGKALTGRTKAPPSVPDRRMTRIAKYLYGRSFKKISSRKVSIRKLSADDPRFASRLPGLTKVKDDMEGLIRLRAEVPKDPEPEKDFKSLFFRSETSKEHEAVGGLLDGLLEEGSSAMSPIQNGDQGSDPAAMHGVEAQVESFDDQSPMMKKKSKDS